MSLYEQWQELAGQERTTQEQKAFWDGYFTLETENYKTLISNHDKVYEGKLSALAAEFGMEEIIFAGFLDGINTSLKNEIELDKLESESEVKLDIDFEKLYFNMLEAKAPWLYNLDEWDGVLSVDRRKEITKEQRGAKVFTNEETIGRNDPCPCGSGKKYKKCCGK